MDAAPRPRLSRTWGLAITSALIVLVLAAGAIAAILIRGDGDDDAEEASRAASGPVAAVSHAEPSIKALELSQHTIYVAAGASITWHNDDVEPHTITSDNGWFRADVPAGGTYSFTFDQPGTFTYHCEHHKNIEGVIVVVPSAAVAAQYFDGKSIGDYYRDACAGCHGPTRLGSVGPALLPERLTANDEAYFTAIKNGRPGTVMPPWGPAGLSDEEVWGLVGFIRSAPDQGTIAWTQKEIEGSLEILADESKLPTSPQHKGNLDNLLLITEREARGIAVVDGDTHTLLGRIEASYRAHGYSFDPTSDRWAYNLGRDGWLFKIDLYTLKAVRKVRVGLDARGVAVSDDGKYIIAGNFMPNSAVILDAKTLQPLKVIETRGVNPDGVEVASRVCIVSDVSPQMVGPYFLIALKEAGQIWRIDYSKPDFPIVKVENVGHILHDAFLSPDNRFFYVASQTDNWMAVIDVAEAKVDERISTGTTPHPGSGAAWAADGTIYGATVHAGEGKVTVWDLKTNQIAGTIPTAGPGLFLRSAENSPYVWADALFGNPANTTTVFEKTKPFKVVQVIEEGVQTLHPEFTADGKFVYVADWQGNTVRVYDASSLKKVAELGGITTPTGIFNTSRRHEPLGH